MNRITNMSDDLVEELRQFYRTHRSVVQLIRYIKARGDEASYGYHHLMIMDAFYLSVSQARPMSQWWDEGSSDPEAMSDEELDEQMRIQIGSTRPLWDKDAAKD